jgi:hypothetical protein
MTQPKPAESFLKEAGSVFAIFVKSGYNLVERLHYCARLNKIDAIAPYKRMQSLISHCLCCMKDLIFRPHFWESQNRAQQEAIVRTYKARYFPRKMPPLGMWEVHRIV